MVKGGILKVCCKACIRLTRYQDETNLSTLGFKEVSRDIEYGLLLTFSTKLSP